MLRLKITKLFIFVACVVLVFACKQKKVFTDELSNPSPYFTQLIDVQDATVLRGVSFGLNQSSVKEVEKAKLFEETPDHLFYEYTYPSDTTAFSEYVNISYYFNESDVLDLITMDIFLSDTLQVSQLQRTLSEFYTFKYGSPSPDDYHYDVWAASYKDVKSNKTEKFSIALKPIEHEIGLSLEFFRSRNPE